MLSPVLVCLFFCRQDNSITSWQIFMKISRHIEVGKRNNRFDFRNYMDKIPDLGFFFLKDSSTLR